MDTFSSKLGGRSPIEAGTTNSHFDMSGQAWVIACLSIVAVAAFLRLYDLDLVPLHHDEGVNGNFLIRLVREGAYQYDPKNYHGPTLYYFALLFPRLIRAIFGVEAQDKFGLTTTAIRCVPTLFGIATVALILTLRRNLGTIATLSAAALLAISPGAVYLSRYFIHETLFVFFTLAIVVSALKYYKTAHPIHLLLAALSSGLLFATKETSIISAGVLLIALAMTVIYRRLFAEPEYQNKKAKKRALRESSGKTFAERVEESGSLTIWIVLAVAVFIAVNVLFYSSFFTNMKGVTDSLRTFQFWRKTGNEAHVHPFITYFWWLLLQESPLLLLGAAGAMISVFRLQKSFALFCSLWAFGLIAAYSLISYKTPWLCLNFVVSLALVAGIAVEWIVKEIRQLDGTTGTQVLAIVVIFVVFAGLLPGTVRAYTQQQVHAKTFIPGYQTLDLNFVNYDNDDRYYVYVYAHTRRETHKLVQEIERIAERTHQGPQTGMTIVSPDYWPLPWYLRNFKRVGYYGRMSPSTEPIVIASQGQAEEVQAAFGDRYQQVHSGLNLQGNFPLRPGVDLLLYTRRELVK